MLQKSIDEMSLFKKIYILDLCFVVGHFKRRLILKLSIKKILNYVTSIHEIVKACTSSMQLFIVPRNFAEFFLDAYLKS